MTLAQGAIGLAFLAIAQFLISLWVTERLRASLQRENAELLERLRWDLKVREQASRVAEYMALARSLRETDSDADYRKANQLAWELAMWLPPDVYRAMTRALTGRTAEDNELTVSIAVRKLLLGNQAGDLDSEELLVHAPGIGKNAARP